jgi:electron transport complex protein RnfB
VVESILAKSVVSLTGLAAVFGALLAYASRVFAVHRDARVEQIVGVLPGANCGTCGFAGCQGFAEAIVSGKAPEEAFCPPGGSETMVKIAEIMGTDATQVVPRIAVVHCAGGASTAVQRLTYEGLEDCRAAVLVGGSPKACVFGCLGLGTCRAVCPFGAITIDAEGLVRVDAKRCTGCGKCVEACPVTIIELVPRDMRVHVRCSSHDKGPAAKKVCSVACIACQLCVKKCPHGAVRMDDNVAVIEYSKCTNCGICAAVCPTKAIGDEVRARPKALIGSRCEGKGKCSEVCPVKAIAGEPGQRHEVSREICIGCGLCLDACPTRAITMVGALGPQKERD